MTTSSPNPESQPRDLNVRDASEYTDQRRPIIRALKVAGGALVALTLISLMAWGATRDLPGIWAVLLGVAIGGGFVLATCLLYTSPSPRD